jgi:rhodanese-related sulfurtransferase
MHREERPAQVNDALLWWLRLGTKMGKLFHLLIAVALTFGFARTALADDAPLEINGAITISADDLIALVQTTSDLVIIDNRTIADYDAGHIEGALHLVDSEITEEAVLARIAKSKDAPVIFYCNGVKCGRAANATIKAVQWGYSRVYYYALGMAQWKQRGLPLVR